MILQSWIDLGSQERLDDAITDMEQASGWLNKCIGKMHHRWHLRSEAADALADAISQTADVVGELEAQISLANEAKTRVPDEDATDAEIQAWHREHG